MNKVQRTNSLLEARELIFFNTSGYGGVIISEASLPSMASDGNADCMRFGAHMCLSILHMQAEETHLGYFKGLSMSKHTQAPLLHTPTHQRYDRG
jgi:hypothetical protein